MKKLLIKPVAIDRKMYPVIALLYISSIFSSSGQKFCINDHSHLLWRCSPAYSGLVLNRKQYHSPGGLIKGCLFSPMKKLGFSLLHSSAFGHAPLSWRSGCLASEARTRKTRAFSRTLGLKLQAFRSPMWLSSTAVQLSKSCNDHFHTVMKNTTFWEM